jgi:hypothetical protein
MIEDMNSPSSAFRFLEKAIFLRGGVSRLALVLSVTVSLPGCGKGSKSAETPAMPQATQEVAQVESSSPNGAAQSHEAVKPAVVPESGDESAVLAQLTQALRKFGVERRQTPKSLDEIVSAGYLQRVPAAPAGKQFVIDPKHFQVVLVNR